MEILEYKFFLFWAAISAIFLKLALETIDNTVLSNSVSPLVIFLFKHSSAMFTCYSSNHAFCRSRVSGPYLLFFTIGIFTLVILTGGSMVHCYLPMYAVTSQYCLFITANSNDGRFSPKWKLVLYACYIIATAFVIVRVPAFVPTNFKGHAETLTVMAITVQNFLCIILLDDACFSSKWKLVSYACYIIAAAFASVPLPSFGRTNFKGYVYTLTMSCGSLCLPPFLFQTNESGNGKGKGKGEGEGEGESLPKTDPVHDPNLILAILDESNYKIKKSVEFAVGLLGTILFQNFFRLNSFKQVVGFIYFAVLWLANITMLSASHDLGVFNFLLGNAIVGCSVGEFGLTGKTWIAYAVSVFLYCFRLKIESLTIVNRGDGNRKVVL